jgi:hypothetical protein
MVCIVTEFTIEQFNLPSLQKMERLEQAISRLTYPRSLVYENL